MGEVDNLFHKLQSLVVRREVEDILCWRESNNRRAFNDVERSDQAIKSIFMYTFVNWGGVYIEDHTLSLINFVKWLFVRYGERFFLVSLLFLGFVCMLRVYLFRCLLGASNASPFFRLPKKKNYDLGYSWACIPKSHQLAYSILYLLQAYNVILSDCLPRLHKMWQCLEAQWDFLAFLSFVTFLLSSLRLHQSFCAFFNLHYLSQVSSSWNRPLPNCWLLRFNVNIRTLSTEKGISLMSKSMFETSN